MSRSSDKKMRPITTKDVESVQQKWVWDLGNSVLYDLCKNHPAHKSNEDIVAKVWLIGRSYAASIERRRNAEQIGDDFYESIVAPAMKASGIDTWIASISPTAAPGASGTISAHKKLTDLFKSITRLEKRSLASKYLHFHRPDAFYIYDSRAREAITKVVPRLNEIPDIAVDECDTEYKDFVRRCVWLRKCIDTPHSIKLTPREIDKLLLMIAHDEARVRTKPSALRDE